MKKNGMSIGAIIAIVVFVALFLGIVIWRVADKKASQIDYSKYDVNSVIEGTEDNGNIADHVKGDLSTAKVVVFEYADYQCSGCASAVSTVNSIIEEYEGKVALVYRSFLLSYHQNANAAASAAEAAGLQGYWEEYADRLFANQSVWSSASGDSRTDMFVDLFTTVSNGNGDAEKFKSDLSSTEVKKKIAFDIGLSKDLDITGTPSFFINGEKVNFTSSSTSLSDVLKEAIDSALEKTE